VVGHCFIRRNIFIEAIWRFFEALVILFKERPDMVIGFGGRDSFFLVFLGSAFGFDSAIYELNRTFGKANFLLSFFVKKIFRGFPIEGKLDKKTKVIGIPLRQNIKIIDKIKAKEKLGFDQRIVVFCFGGSQGSFFLNKTIVRLAEELKVDFQLIHLTGSRGYVEISQAYNTIDRKRFVKDFYCQMEDLYSAADIVVCRAGASTLAELAFYQIPAVLFPHGSAGGHQADNALFLKEKGAAFVFDEKDFYFEGFKLTIDKLLSDAALRQAMRDNLTNVKSELIYGESLEKYISV
jgi:UDP-N-acetylglucosamine--N-acetylmuramyl-(pentapeptide) pyrophosphoryl-undecaprenol N-acetylglucosamine transferase